MGDPVTFSARTPPRHIFNDSIEFIHPSTFVRCSHMAFNKRRIKMKSYGLFPYHLPPLGLYIEKHPVYDKTQLLLQFCTDFMHILLFTFVASCTSCTPDLSVDNLNMEYLNAGLFFPRNCDIDGKVILIQKSKLHIRGLRDTEQLLRVFIYWVERLNR